ncbi:hypothetical protein D9M68_737790 [compost metagenome]
MRSIAPKKLFRWRDAGAIDQPVQPAERLQGGSHSLAAIVLTGDVGVHEARVAAQLLGTRRSSLRIDIGEQHLAAQADQLAGGGQAQAGTGASQQKYSIFDSHLLGSSISERPP